MAAYAALVSLNHIINQLQHHPNTPISLEKNQTESLTEKITFLQEFLESYSINSGNEEYEHDLLSRIADAAYEAEDIIESNIVIQILASTTTDLEEDKIRSSDLYQGLKKVILGMDLIKREVMEIKEMKRIQNPKQQISASAGSRDFLSTAHRIMVGLEDVKIEIMDRLTRPSSYRQITLIFGMGGIGKTTLARNIYSAPLIKHHFDILAWATISQQYNATEILLQLLVCVQGEGNRGSLNHKSQHELGEILYKTLVGRRYLVVLDDMWSIEAWEKVHFFFPDNNNGSRMMVTTRMSDLAIQLNGSDILEMNLLDGDKSLNLLCKSVFGEQECPLELKETGMKIARNCKGLPLSIVVIGGLLAKSKKTLQYWEYVAENLNPILNREDDERCLKVLETSYNWLPVHLKSCFMYMGIFREDSTIRVSDLIKLWVAEGFLKPIPGKTLETVAEDNLNDLIQRNLVSIHSCSFNGKIKFCSMHDILRDLCLREARKHKFLCIVSRHDLEVRQIQDRRHIGVHAGTTPKSIDTLQSAPFARSLICDIHFQDVLPLRTFRLLRVLRAQRAINQKTYFGKRDVRYRPNDIFQLVNSRFLAVDSDWSWISRVPSSIHLFWNLQTLIVKGRHQLFAPPEIWRMPRLRHVKFDELYLPNTRGDDEFVLDSLQTLSRVGDFKCGEDVIKRIPNLRKLKIFYWALEGWSRYSLGNLQLMRKLESLGCYWCAHEMRSGKELVRSLAFPGWLRELTLEGCRLEWGDLAAKVGPLPSLEVLRLKTWSFVGPEWETVEGHFCNLRALLVCRCDDLERWTTDRAHFPRLERLRMRRMYRLREIPPEIGEIATLELLEVTGCTPTANASAVRIREEQEEMGNVGLQVRVGP
ncbi:disease resistance protein [Striga asiatica]|uniref:Disease resistance protein n=1 Tax=Striga asiatica TaxID=4170 RepID=A0A5A7QTF5_STRAF|nr:disease resistance protein [Striga asiatica]